MMRQEFLLQFRSRRMVGMTLALVVVVLLVHLQMRVMHFTFVQMHGFQVLETIEGLVLNLMLPVVVIFEAFFWFGRHYSEGTLQWFFFAGLPRRRHWPLRLSVFGIRVAVQFGLIILTALAGYFLVWGASSYELGTGSIPVLEQMARFLFAASHSFLIALAWSGIGFAVVVGTQGKRFDSGAMVWTGFALYILFIHNVSNGPLSLFGGGMQMWFRANRLTPSLYGEWVASMVIGLGILGSACLAGLLLYSRKNISPQERLS